MSPLVGWEDVAVVAPVAILASGALAVMALDAFLPSATPREGLSLVGVGVLLAALAASVASDEGSRVAFGGAVQVDAFGRAATSVISAATALALLAAQAQVARWGLPPGEVVALFLLSATAAAYLAVAADLAGVFLGIEGMSLPLYALAAIRREDPRGSEAGLKYFALGALASGLLLYGMALLYGASGTLALAGLWPSTAPPGLLAVGAALVLAGLAFKVGAVPFHWWVPDAYQGAPASVTAYMATAVKVAAFAALGRVLVLALEAGHAVWGPALWWIAAATLVLGNLLAVAQTSVKRMLAYSGIAHTGYALIGLVAAGEGEGGGVGALLFYLAAYSAMTVGAFAVPVLAGRGGEELDEVEDWRGLAARRPWVALAATVLLASLAGLPPTAGFVAKLGVFRSGVEAGQLDLVVLGALTTIVSIYYYLRPVVAMYFHDPVGHGPDTQDDPASWGPAAAVGVSALAVLSLGVFPGWLLAALRDPAVGWF